MSKVVIIGAGISGLTVAFRLQQLLPSAEITVLERNGRPGGTIWTERHDGFQVEIGPNGFLDSKPSTLTLCKDLGLANQLTPASESASRFRYLFLDGQLRLLPHSFKTLITTDLLSWSGKFNLLAERFRPARRQAGDESIDEFARRRAGREVAEVFADALVTGIHAGDPKLLSVGAAFPRLTALEKKYGSVMKGFSKSAQERREEAKTRGEPDQRSGKMWSLRPGMRLLIETLKEKLKNPPILGVGAERVTQSEHAGKKSWSVSAGHDSWPADAVILTCPAYQQAALVHELDPDLAERVNGIPYNRVAVIALGYRRSDVPHDLNGFGFIAPQRTRRDILGVQWCSSIFSERAPQDMILLRAMAGGWHRPEVVGWDEGRLLEAVRAELKETMGIRALPVFHHITRWDRAIPQYVLGHLDHVAWIENRLEQHPGLYLGGNAYHGVALNDCTEQAERLAFQTSRYLEALRKS